MTISQQLAGGRSVVISALLVDEVKTAPPSFDKRYAELTAGADLIVYNGHAGLGSNIAALQTEVAFVGKSESVLYTSDLLPAGKYVFTLLADAALPGGDADLRVRAGAAPDLTQTWKCKSYVGNSNERCVLQLAAPAKIFMSVTGDAPGVQSHFELRAFAQ